MGDEYFQELINDIYQKAFWQGVFYDREDKSEIAEIIVRVLEDLK